MSEAKQSIDASSGAMKKSETESIENLMDQDERLTPKTMLL